MTDEEIQKLRKQLDQTISHISLMDTPEHEARLTLEFQKYGVSLKRVKQGPSGFSIKLSDGSKISGVTLADADELLGKFKSTKQRKAPD